MVGFKKILGSAVAAGGYLVGQRFIPEISPLGKSTDLLVGIGAMAVGMAIKQDLVVAFGTGLAVEGLMVAIGL